MATAMGGAAATSDCEGGGELGASCSDITGGGTVSAATGVDGVAVPTRTENGAREVAVIGNLLKVKGREERKCV